jgi:hypothetical protein
MPQLRRRHRADGLPRGFDENPKPGKDGITRSKSSVRLDDFLELKHEPGHPCVRISGIGFAPRPRT